MPTIYIDKQPYEVEEGQNLLQACLGLGFNLPFFCWHPAMGSVGACRQCAVKQFRDENDTKGRIVMACMTPAADKTYISIFDPDVVAFRASVIEWLMVNHPHDCPVCDEGGECHLQDMTLMTGHDYRRYDGQKRTFYNQNLGPFITHQINRCIQCYRCVRYYRGVAGGRDLDAFSIHNTVFFGRAADGPLESEFSGNLVEVCPTGVFTDKTLMRHYVRKWDIQTSPSICVHCSVGCNTFPGERLKVLRRIRSRYNGDVNGYFLCDRGRFGYEFVNHERRIRLPKVQGVPPVEDREVIMRQVSKMLPDPSRMIGIGSPRASLEANFALRTLVGENNFYQGIPERERNLVNQIIKILQNGPARSPSLQEIAHCDAVLVLGEDVSNTAPMIALALRESVRQQPKKKAAKLKIPDWDDYSTRLVIQDEKGPLFIATPAGTRIDDIATGLLRAAPDDIARLGFAVAHELDANAAQVPNLTPKEQELVQNIAQALKTAERPLIIAGTSLGNQAIIQAAASAAWALHKTGLPASLSYVVAENNSMGLGLMGGKSLESACEAVQSGKVDTIIIMENNLAYQMPAQQLDAFLGGAKQVIVLDVVESPLSERASVVLPAGTFAESSGSFVNNEGRVQRFYQTFVPVGAVLESWRWIKGILNAIGRPEAEPWENLDGIQAALVEALPVFKPLLDVAPPADFRIHGARIPRQPHRWSGRTANYANINVEEQAPPIDPDTPFSYSMEGAKLQPPPALIPRFWAPAWNSAQAVIKYTSPVPGPLEGGNPGCRLIEANSQATPPEFRDIPQPFQPKAGELLVVPLYHVFGSDDLSMLSPGIAELAPQPYIAINIEDLASLKGTALVIEEPGQTPTSQEMGNETAEISIQGVTYRLLIRQDTQISKGMVGLPIGLPEMPGIHSTALPASTKVTLSGQSREKGQDQP